VWLKLPTKELRALAGKQLKLLSGGKEPARMQQLRMPYDRYGEMHKRTHLQTCDALDEALSNYRGTCWLCQFCPFTSVTSCFELQLTKNIGALWDYKFVCCTRGRTCRRVMHWTRRSATTEVRAGSVICVILCYVLSCSAWRESEVGVRKMCSMFSV
jgi:hypothetical protein